MSSRLKLLLVIAAGLALALWRPWRIRLLNPDSPEVVQRIERIRSRLPDDFPSAGEPGEDNAWFWLAQVQALCTERPADVQAIQEWYVSEEPASALPTGAFTLATQDAAPLLTRAAECASAVIIPAPQYASTAPNLTTCVSASQFYAVAFDHYLSKGDFPNASRIAEECARLGAIVGRGPAPSAGPTGNLLTGRAMASYRALATHGATTPELLADAVQTLAEFVDRRAEIANSIRLEYYFWNSEFARYSRTPTAFANALESRARDLRYAEELDSGRDLWEVSRSLNRRRRSRQTPNAVDAEMILEPDVCRLFDISTAVQADVERTRALLSIAAFAKRTGARPQSISALGEVFIDPWTGESFEYDSATGQLRYDKNPALAELGTD